MRGCNPAIVRCGGVEMWGWMVGQVGCRSGLCSLRLWPVTVRASSTRRTGEVGMLTPGAWVTAVGAKQARMATTALALEGFVAFFAMLAAYPLAEGSARPWISGGLALMGVCFVAAGVTKRSGGMAAAWCVQLVLLAGCVVFPPFLVLAPVFVAIFAWLVRIGYRIDKDEAAREGTAA